MENSKEKAILLIGCMDFRVIPLIDILTDRETKLDEKLEMAKELFKDPEKENKKQYEDFANILKATDGKVVKDLTNAGGDVRRLQKSIAKIMRDFEVERVILIPHDDCGAMKLFYSYIANDTHGELVADYVRKLGDLDYTKAEMKELHVERAIGPMVEANYKLQSDVASKTFKNIPVGLYKASMKSLKLGDKHAEHFIWSDIYQEIGLMPGTFYRVKGLREECEFDIEVVRDVLGKVDSTKHALERIEILKIIEKTRGSEEFRHREHGKRKVR